MTSYPSSDSASFNGAWSNYPYFESGNVIVSGIEQGLFVLRPTSLTPFTLASTTQNLDFCGDGSGSAPVDLAGRAGFANPVDLTVSGMPADMSASITPQNVVPPASLSLQIGVSNVASGVYPLTVTGTDGLDDFSIALDVLVSADLPGTAMLTTPANNAAGMSVFQSVYWNPAAGGFSLRCGCGHRRGVYQRRGRCQQHYGHFVHPARRP